MMNALSGALGAAVDPIAVPRRWASRVEPRGVSAGRGLDAWGAHEHSPMPQPLAFDHLRSCPCQQAVRPLPGEPKMPANEGGPLSRGLTSGSGTWRIPTSISQKLALSYLGTQTSPWIPGSFNNPRRLSPSHRFYLLGLLSACPDTSSSSIINTYYVTYLTVPNLFVQDTAPQASPSLDHYTLLIPCLLLCSAHLILHRCHHHQLTSWHPAWRM
jgi:hypothetical protein